MRKLPGSRIQDGAPTSAALICSLPSEAEDERPCPGSIAKGTQTIPYLKIDEVPLASLKPRLGDEPVGGSAISSVINTLNVADAISPWLLASCFLRMFDTEQLRLLCEAGRPMTVGAGQVIYRAGEEPTSAYFIVDGEVEIEAPWGSTRESGEFFGEAAIVSHSNHRETVRACSGVTLIEWPVVVLRMLLRSGASQNDGSDSSSMLRQLSMAALRQSVFNDLEEDALAALGQRCHLESFEGGQLVGGPINGKDSVYVVVSGTLQCIEAYEHRKTIIGRLHTGAVFRMAGMGSARTIVARSRGWLLRLDRLAIAKLSATNPRTLALFGAYL